MGYLEKCKLKNQLDRAIYAIRVSQSPFTLSPQVYAVQATNILNAIRKGV